MNKIQNKDIVNNKKVKSSVWFWLILIIAIAAFFRFWQIQNIPPGLYPDEAMNGNNALEAIEKGGFKIFYPENNGREGLFINIQALSIAILGNKPWALRLVSSIFGVLTILGVYFLTKELFNKNHKSQFRVLGTNHKQTQSRALGTKFKKLEKNEIIALIASFLLAASFWHIIFSRIGFRAIMAPFFLVWGLYFLLLSFRKMAFFEEVEEKNKLKNLKLNLISKFKKLKYKIFNTATMKWQLKFGNLASIAGAIYGLGFHSYIAYRATPVLIILIFAYFWFKRKEDRVKILFSGFLFFISFFIVISPLLSYFINNPQDFLGRTSQISVFSSENPAKDLTLNTVKTLGMFWYQGDFNWRHNFAGEPQLFWPIGILFGLGILICVFRISKLQITIPSTRDKLQINPKLQIQSRVLGTKLEIDKKNILPELILIIWLIIGLLPVIISNESLPHALRAIIIIPVVMIISAIGLEFIIKKGGDLIKNRQENHPERAIQIQRIRKELFILLIVFLASTGTHSFNMYFLRWAGNPNVADAFSEKYAEIGNYLNSLPKELPKYVIVNANGADVRGTPMPSQTIMFITKTFLPEWQKEKNIYYILPGELNQISCENSCVITMLESDSLLRRQLKERIKNLLLDGSPGFAVLKNF